MDFEFQNMETNIPVRRETRLAELRQSSQTQRRARIIRGLQLIQCSKFAKLATLSVMCLLAVVNASQAYDESLIESFSGPRVSWRLVEEDCGVVITGHARIQDTEAHNATFESIEFTAGNGTRAYWQHEIEPVHIIPELIPSLWIRSNQKQIRLHALVVLPNTLAPDGRQPIQFLIDGPAYEDVGRWQKLSFANANADIATLVKQKVVVYRTSLGAEVNADGAYVAAIVINAYTGPVSTIVQIDDLTLEGNIPWDGRRFNVGETYDNSGSRQREGAPDESISRTEAREMLVEQNRTSSSVVAHGSGQIEVNGVPFFARVVQHRGESLFELSELGFNVVLLDHPPTVAISEEAASVGIWLVCPPHVQPVQDSVNLYRRVLAWNLGHGLILEDLERVRQRCVAWINRPDLPRRPTYAHLHQGIAYFGQYVDIVEIGRPLTGTSVSSDEYYAWLRKRINQAPDRATVWATVRTQYPSRLIDQASRMARVSDPVVTPAELESQAIEAVAAGCRGLSFQNSIRLDGLDHETGQRRRSLRWVNEQLEPLEPWVAAGTTVGDGFRLTNDVAVDTIITNRGELLLVRQRESDRVQRNGRPEPITLNIEQSSLGSSVYLISSHGSVPLRHDRRTGLLRLRLENVYNCTKIVVTQDPLALQHLANRSPDWIRDHVSLHADCLADWQVGFERLLEQLSNEGAHVETTHRLVEQAGRTLSEARRFLLTGDSRTAENLLRNTQWKLDHASNELMRTFRAPFPNPLASPLLAAPEWLPQHLQFGDTIARSAWGENALPAGEFNSLPHLQSTGWTNHRSQDARLSTQVDLLNSYREPSDRFLRMQVTARDDMPRQALMEDTPLWIVSPPVHVRAHQIVRIHGRVKFVDTDPNQDGEFLIMESIGGMMLAERYSADTEWKEFTVYRMASTDQPVRVTFALTGPGEAFVDDVEIQVTSLPSHSLSATPYRQNVIE